MARTTQQIFDSMVAEGIAKATADGNTDALAMFANTSKVAIWRLMFYIMAFAIMTFEKLLDAFKTDVDNQLTALIPGKITWYQTKFKAFQYGFNLLPGSDLFNNTGKTDAEIAASKIIKYAAVTEATVDNKRVLLVKIAKLSGTDLVPLLPEELLSFTTYVNTIKYAGVTIVIYNQVADLLRSEVNVYYNPLLLNEQGMRIDGAGYPVREAAIAYPLTLEFDGEFINAGFIDALQACYGVSRRKVNLVRMERKTGNGNFTSVGSSFIPDAGYCKFEPNEPNTNKGLIINYIADV